MTAENLRIQKLKFWGKFVIITALFLLTIHFATATLNSSDLYAYFNLDNTTGDTVNPSKVGTSIINFSATGQVFVSGKFNNSPHIDSSTYLDFNSFTYPQYNNTGTISFWLERHGSGGNIAFTYEDTILANSLMTSTTAYMLVLLGANQNGIASGKIGIDMSGTVLSTNGSCSDNVWCHVAITGNGGIDEIKFYINGNLQTLTYISGSNLKKFFYSPNQWKLGTAFRQSTPIPASSMHGLVDDLAFWKYNLNASQILELYNNRTWVFNYTGEPCSEQWILNNSVCDGWNITIKYYDNSSCGTYLNLSSDNGTKINCHCSPSWATNSILPCIGNVMTKIYRDSNICNSSESLPIDNGSYSACTLTITDLETTNLSIFFLCILILAFLIIEGKKYKDSIEK